MWLCLEATELIYGDVHHICLYIRRNPKTERISRISISEVYKTAAYAYIRNIGMHTV